MKKLFNYKGLLVLWIAVSILYYGWVKINPVYDTYYVSGDLEHSSTLDEGYINKLEFLPYISLSGIVLIGGAGYLLSKK